MSEGRPEPERTQLRLVELALDGEVGDQSELLPPDVLLAMNAVCGRLGVYLGRWIGADGWQLLMDRALTDVAEAGALDGLALGVGAELRWTNDATRARARDACVQVLAAVVRALGRMIGPALALRLVEQALTRGDGASRGGSDHG